MNTVEKGDAFEDRVYKVFKTLLQNDELPINSKRTKVFQKKGYYSEAQKSEIIFDISIESYLPNSTNYSILHLIECKDYKSAIEVSKVRNFREQVREVRGHKGWFVATSKFQKGAIDIAKSCGMSLAIMNITDELSWILKRSTSTHISVEEDSNEYFIVSTENKTTTNLIEFLQFEGFDIVQNTSKLKVKYLTESDIERALADGLKSCKYSEKLDLPYMSKREFKRISQDCPRLLDKLENFYLQDTDMIEILKEKYNIEVITDYELNNYELGRLDLSQRKIYLSDKLVYGSARWRFTLAHEFAHVALHENILIESNSFIISDHNNMDDPYLNLSTLIQSPTVKRMEIQANIFACSLLMPLIPMTVEFIKAKSNLGINQNFIYVDDQSVNITNCKKIIFQISSKFGVSDQVVRYKLYDLNFIKDFSRTQNLRKGLESLKALMKI